MLIMFILLCCVFKLYSEKWEYVLISAVCVWTAYMFAITEVLSVFYQLTGIACWISYLIPTIILLILVIRGRKRLYVTMSRFERKYIPIISIAVITLFLALTTIPYNWDSMTYHLPRIMHWVQNKSVAHYASNSIRQLTSPMLSEFVNVQVYLMYGENDLLFNLLQWGAYVGNAILVMTISHKLHVSKNMSVLAGFLFMTMPIAFAEALTTQNDQYTAFWLLLFVDMIIDLYSVDEMKFRREQIGQVVLLSACIAFGYLAKPSIFFAILIFASGLLICCILRKDSIVCLVKMILVSISSMLPLMLPEMIRNIISFHALSSPEAGARQLVGTYNPLYLFVNFLKNFVYNFPNKYFDIAELCDKIVYWTAYKLKVDINDESISEGALAFELHPAGTYQHDKALNPIIIFSCIFLIIIVICLAKKIEWKKNQKMYCILASLSFAALCIFMRWEHFVTRYMLAYLALLCPMAVVLLSKIRESSVKKYVWDGVIGILIFISFSELISMITYHYKISGIENKCEAYFVAREWEYFDFQNTVDFANNKAYSSIGLMLGGNTYEYPIWSSLEGNVRIQHVNVENESVMYYDSEFVPQCIWIWDCDAEESISLNGVIYKEVLNNGRSRLLERQ